MNSSTNYNIVCLAGGVGGAKLAHGLAQIVPPERLTIIVNTGDDFQHMGLTICPDLDTVMYALAGTANAATGWGRADESFHVLDEVARLGGPDWFRLGDLDLATHLVRTHLLATGQTLTAVTQHLCRHLHIQPDVLPMSNQPAPTFIQSGARRLPFQTWFVAERWQPPVDKVVLPENVRASAQVTHKLEKADIVILAPSNPFVSLDPILNVYPIREMVMDLPQAVVAVSPIVGGQAVKGPAAKMMQERGLAVSATAVRDYYGDLLDGFVYDVQDADAEPPAGMTLCVDTMMHDDADRRRLAQDVLALAQRIIVATAE